MPSLCRVSSTHETPDATHVGATPTPTAGVRGDARRLSTMLRHSMHLFIGLLWLVGLGHALADGRHVVLQTLAALLFLGCYLAGLLVRDQRRRHLLGRAWIGALVLLWAGLLALDGVWAWLGFPLFFLVLFILPRGWPVVAAMAAGAVVFPLLRGEPLGVGGVLGPVLGAGVAVVVWLVVGQLRRDAERQRVLAEQLAAAAERERLGRELHDSLAQGLNSIVMLSRAGAAEHPQAADQFDLVERTARENLAQARVLVRELTDGGGGLDERLVTLVAGVNEQQRALGSDLQLDLVVDGSPRPLPAEVVEGLVQATRASLANVTQHAHARRARVSLTWYEEGIGLDVVDDGVGFEQAGTPGGWGGFGLTALRDRVRELGGTVEVTSAPGDGCAVAIELPATMGATERGGGRP